MIDVGSRIGSYEVTARLGAGGMGVVFRARDRKLSRDVALKALPHEFMNDPNRLSRFQREAQVLAALNHPNIAHIYGFEEDSGQSCIILELVEGTTLEQLLIGGPPPLRDVLDICRQVAEALDAAHERGIIHRDLKPGNIMVAADGRVKVLDFGLAKHVDDEASQNSSSLRTRVTDTSGPDARIGTVAYMSPEQARGQALDKRTDIWSFGCVVYELLTGSHPFPGNNASDLIAGILERQPDWTAVPAGVPPDIRKLLQRCLEKDSRRRLRDIGDARNIIDDVVSSQSPLSTTTISAPKHRAAWTISTAIVVAFLIGMLVARNLKRGSPVAPASQARFTLLMPPNLRFASGATLAVSPAGDRVAFVGRDSETSQIYIYSIATGETHPVTEGQGGVQPFFSPDGQWLAFFAGGKLKKAPVTGGAPTTITDAPAARGGFWGDDGTIVFTPTARGTGIVQVSANGGTAKPITTLDNSKGETSHRWSELLPDGSAILFSSYGATYQDVSIVAQSLKTGKRQTVVESAGQPHYVPATGHLLYVQPSIPGVVFAVPFDPDKLQTKGTPVAVTDGVLTDRGDSTVWALSRSGMLVYAPGGLREGKSALLIVDRTGNARPFPVPADRAYGKPRLSPDGSRLVVVVGGTQTSLWMYESSNQSFNRFSFEGNNGWPIWSPDGKQVTFASNRTQPWRIFSKPSDGTGTDQILLPTDSGNQQPYSWSPDGNLLFQDVSLDTGQDVWLMEGAHQVRPFLHTKAAELDARFSPDGHWVAYASNESGRYEVYVVPFPGPGGKWQISTEGGREPVWSHSGRELFFRSGNKMMVVSITAQADSLRAGSPRTLFQGSYLQTSTITPEYDVTTDDQHFIMIQPSDDTSTNTQLNVILNWVTRLSK